MYSRKFTIADVNTFQVEGYKGKKERKKKEKISWVDT